MPTLADSCSFTSSGTADIKSSRSMSHPTNAALGRVLGPDYRRDQIQREQPPGTDLTGSYYTKLYCAHGDVVTYPTVTVNFGVAGREVTT